MYVKKLEEKLVKEWEFLKKQLDDLYMICENCIMCVASILCSYNRIYILCIAIVFI